MTNFLSFDIYDIDLSKVINDYNLNFVLLPTTNKSIIVLEDFDRFLKEKSIAVIFFSSLGGRVQALVGGYPENDW
jgi:hypothetical protein